MDDEEDEVPTCPLCLEELDATDRAVKACQCGYQVCLWCLHHIREQLSARCPACRTPYEEQNFKFAEVNPEQAAKEAKERATAKKERERREKLKEVERERARAALVSQQKAKNNLKHVRILQRNLVYVIGLSLTLAREEVIRRADMFGKFGRMVRVLVNRAHPFNADAPGGPSISAYVQYYRDSDASAAVRAMNNAVLDGREIRCAIATTKYCDVFVRSAAALDPNATHHCGNALCMYYHSISQPENVLSREEVLARQLGPPPPAHLFLVDPRRPHMQGMQLQRPGAPPPGSLPIIATPNSSVSSNAPVLPGHRVVTSRVTGLPMGSSSTVAASMHSSNVTSSNGGHLISGHVNSNLSSNIAIPNSSLTAHSTAAPGHPPLASSPRLRSVSVAGGNRRPVLQPRAASPSESPQRTPPSSPGIRRSVPRLSRSPVRDDGTNSSNAGSSMLPSGSVGAATATSAPYFSPPSSSAQLPSTAGWGLSHHGRAKSRSPPRRGPSSSFDDPSRLRPRVQIRRRENAPPGFEDTVLANPSRPPGFDVPDPNHGMNRAQMRSEIVRSTTLPPTSSGPPGFGPSPAVSKDGISEESSPSDVAAAWAQEASTDEVFMMGERRAMRPVGEPSHRNMHEDKTALDSRTELAQVLAKIGGDLGVSSEFHNVKAVPTPFADQAEMALGKMGGNGSQGHLGTLFGNQPYHGNYTPPTSGSPPHIERAKPTPPPSYEARSAGLASLFERSSTSALRPEIMPVRRNNSRFDFARNNEPEQISRAAASSIPAPQSMVGSIVEEKLAGNVSAKSDSFPGTNGMPTESHIISEMSRNSAAMHPSVPAVPQVPRQSRSRFDFADQGLSPPKASHVNLNTAYPTVQRPSVPESNPVNTSFVETFANLTTEEKLASIFSSAEWAAEKLPPMPKNDQEVKQVTGQVSEPAATFQSRTQLLNPVTAPMPSTSSDPPKNIEEHIRPTPASQPVQFAPPGFREAAPGISPETTAVDTTSTSSGVATSVASGGITNNADSSAQGLTEESQSSGTESLEDERKRSRGQRKRDKKTRQAKETCERKSTEPETIETSSSAPGSTGTGGGKEDKQVATTPVVLHDVKREAPVETLAKPEEVLKQLVPNKLSDDPGRFMSVSELEREVEAARAREAQLQDRLLELQRRIRSYDNVRT